MHERQASIRFCLAAATVLLLCAGGCSSAQEASARTPVRRVVIQPATATGPAAKATSKPVIDDLDPFLLAVTAEAEQLAEPSPPIFTDAVEPNRPLARRPAQRPESADGRLFIDSAVLLYGETASTSGPGVQPPAVTSVLDGLESLQQVSFSVEGADFDPCIARNGQVMVYASTQHRRTADIYMKRLDGRSVTQLTADPAHDVMPAISPDGSRIAFCSNRAGSWDVFMMSSEGGQAVQLTMTSAHELHPSWSPDGTKLVFSRLGERSGRWEMWVMDVDQPVVSEFIGYGLFPEWCPVAGTGLNGRDKILFQRSLERGDRRFSVWTIDYREGDVSSPTELAASQIAAVINPSWSPDGKRIAFATVSDPDRTGWGTGARPAAADVWMMDVDGGARVNLTKGRFVNLMPVWGPQGRVYFVSDREGADNIWSIGTDKAIQAATGRPPASRTDIATVPDTAPTP